MPGSNILFQSSGQLEAVDTRDIEIRNDNVGDQGVGPFEGLEPIVRLFDPKPGLREPFGVQPAPIPVILDEQHDRRLRSAHVFTSILNDFSGQAARALQLVRDLEVRVMGLRDTYAYAISVAKGKFDGSAQEKDGKLHFVGSVKTEDEKNEIWSAIKTIPSWRDDVVADIKVTGGGAAAGGGAASAQAGTTYTVQPGDTLSKIAKQHLGDGNAYMKIFNANKDQLSDPDKIKPGQVLKIPAN